MDIQYLDHLADTDNQIIHQCAELYCKIWQEPPWNEHCWNKDEVVRDIKSQLMQPNAKIILAFYDGNIIGFTWGYQVSPTYMQKICGSKSLNFIFKKGAVYYVDELGVSISHRGNGIGMTLANKLLDAIPKNIDAIILRTDKKALPAREIYKKLNFAELEILDKKFPSRSYWLKTLP